MLISRGCADYALKVFVSIPGTILVVVLFFTVLPPVPRFVENAGFWVLVAWWDYLLVVIPLQWKGSSWVTKEAGLGTWLGTVFLTSFIYLGAIYLLLPPGSRFFTGSAATLFLTGAFLASSAIFALILKTPFARGVGLAVTQIVLSFLLVWVSAILFAFSMSVSGNLQSVYLLSSWHLVSDNPTTLLFLIAPTLVVSFLVARFIRGANHAMVLAITYCLIATLAEFAVFGIIVLFRPELAHLGNIEDVIRFMMSLAVVGNLLSISVIIGRRLAR